MSEPHKNPLPLLALTGGIGSGKSTVADLFRQHGALVISADRISRELLEPEAVGYRKLREAFGDRFLTANGQVDRVALRQAIFADPALRARVDGLLHPLIRARIAEIVAGTGLGSRPAPIRTPVYRGIVVEVPLLYEVGWQDDFDWVLVVRADDRQARARLMARDRVSQAEAEAALAAQLPIQEKIARADSVIDNRGNREKTAQQVAQIIERLLAGEVCRAGLKTSNPSN